MRPPRIEMRMRESGRGGGGAEGDRGGGSGEGDYGGGRSE